MEGLKGQCQSHLDLRYYEICRLYIYLLLNLFGFEVVWYNGLLSNLLNLIIFTGGRRPIKAITFALFSFISSIYHQVYH